MASVNQVLLVGNLTRDPELRYTAKGTAVCQFSLALNHRFTNAAGEKKEEVCFVECSLFSKSAESFDQYLTRGRAVLVTGRLRLEEWEDKTTRAKRSKLVVVCDAWHFVDKQTNGPAATTPKPILDAVAAAEAATANPDWNV